MATKRYTRKSSTSRGVRQQQTLDAWSRRPGGTDWDDRKVASVTRGFAQAYGAAGTVEGDRVAALMSGDRSSTSRGGELYEALGEQVAEMLLNAIQAGLVDPEALLGSIAAGADDAMRKHNVDGSTVGGILGAAVGAVRQYGVTGAKVLATAGLAYGAGRSIYQSGQGGRQTNLVGPAVGAAAGGYLGSRVGLGAVGTAAGGWLGSVVQNVVENVVPGGDGKPGRRVTVENPNLAQGEDLDMDGIPDVQDPFPEDSQH